MTELRDLINNPQAFKILIVDDKANMRRTIRNMLRQIGFTNYREAEDGDVALRKIRSEMFDFVICDWLMPRMNGIEVLRTIREEDRFKDLPFMIITAEVEEGTVAESIEADVDGYILKPFVPKTLEDKMVEIMTRKMSPPPLETHLQAAEVFLRAGNYQKAHEELDGAAGISARSPKIHYMRGLAFEAEGKLDEAEQAYSQARQWGPKFIRAHEKLADIYAKQGRGADMLKVIKEAVAVSPKNADRQTKLGEALLTDGRIQEAKKAFNEALRIDPGNTARMTAIGEAYLANGLAQEAEKAFKASIEKNPENVYVYNRLGIAFRRQKKFDEAIRYYNMALAIDPDEEGLLYNLARAHLGEGNREDAVDALHRALKLNPRFQEAQDLLVMITSQNT